MGPKGLVKIWSVTAEYSWYGQMSPKQMLPGQISPRQLASIKDGPRNTPLRFGQNRVSNSWDIPDMEKSRQVKCCLNKCHRDSLNLFKMAQSTYFLSYLSLIRLPVMSESCALALIQLLMIRRWWRWRWRFHRDYIANSAQLNWDLAELGNIIFEFFRKIPFAEQILG